MAEGFKVIETQEQFDAMISKRLERERQTIESRFADYDQLKEKLAEQETKITELGNTIEANKAERDGLNGQIADLQHKLSINETNSAKMRIAQEYGLPSIIADRLTGDDEESIRADAQNMRDIIGSTRMIKVPLKSTEPVDNGENAYRGIVNDLFNKE